ncbi:MAG: hypothetical protein IT353_15790 [Gemmatimonadaceae bacterium]|nr:hypothetical protein [Gemmatimonadaceae bacterium]
MSAWYLLLAAQYAIGVAIILVVEARRTRETGPDPISLFMFVFLLQCGVPAIGLYGALPFADRFALTGNTAFDGILRSTSFATSQLVFLLAAWFVVCFYLGASLATTLGRSAASRASAPRRIELRLRPLFALLLLGLGITLASFVSLGDSWSARYANLILFRAGFAGLERTAFNANAFSLTQAWSWLSVMCLLALASHKRRWAWWMMLAMAFTFALLGGSRRALFIPLVLWYLATVMHTRQWRVGRMVVAAIPAFLWLAYGKAILAAIAFGGSADSVASEFSSGASALARASAEAGITVVESMGTITSLDLPPRLGVDHALSAIRRLPDGMIGQELDLPERIVRISTTALVGPDALDMPPGLMGQMWLDFRAVGAVLWGLAFGALMGVLSRVAARYERSRTSAAVFALATFLVALPLNSGSLDFNLTVDTILMMLVLAAAVRRLPAPDTSVRETGVPYELRPINIA